MVGTFDSTFDGIDDGAQDDSSATDSEDGCIDETGDASVNVSLDGITVCWSKRLSNDDGGTAFTGEMVGGITVIGASDGAIDNGDVDGDELG